MWSCRFCPHEPRPNLSITDTAVVAYTLEKRANLLLADDADVRRLATQEGLAVIRWQQALAGIGIFS
jgi:hypothetical protein